MTNKGDNNVWNGINPLLWILLNTQFVSKNHLFHFHDLKMLQRICWGYMQYKTSIFKEVLAI